MTVRRMTKDGIEGVFLSTKEYENYKKILEIVDTVISKKKEYDVRYNRW